MMRPSICRTGPCLFMKDVVSLELKCKKILTKKCRKCCLTLKEAKDNRIVLRGTYFDGRSRIYAQCITFKRCSTTKVWTSIEHGQIALVK